jgi:hypothetical protein
MKTPAYLKKSFEKHTSARVGRSKETDEIGVLPENRRGFSTNEKRAEKGWRGRWLKVENSNHHQRSGK